MYAFVQLLEQDIYSWIPLLQSVHWCPGLKSWGRGQLCNLQQTAANLPTAKLVLKSMKDFHVEF